MKKHVVLLVAALTAVSLGLQGCGSKESAAEPTTTAAAETTAAETSAEETTAEETTEAAAEVGETGIPAEYEPYLEWSSDEWNAASDEEKKEAVVAYVLYDAIVYQGLEDMTAEMVKNEPEFDQLYPIIDSGLSNTGFTMKEICDMGHSAVSSLEDVDLDADIVEKLQCNAADWAAADDAGKKEIATAMLMAIGKMTGQDITVEMIESLSDADMDAQIQNIGAMFESGLYDEEATLYELLSQ